ncbi:MAG: InlB B-repeat-containing protein [Gaiellaceae bacterium]
MALAGGAPKVTLTVVVTGKGHVSSKPVGIKCRSACKLHVKKGRHVALTATAVAGSTFSRWSAPCRTARTCKVVMAKSRSVHAFFKRRPAPPPAAKPGHYAGTYSDGSMFDFDVQAAALTNLVFDFNGHCSNGGNLAGPATTVHGTFPVGKDGSVSGHVALTYSNATGTADFAGTFTPTGTGSGTLSISLAFADGGATCTSTGTWTAQDQS